MPRLTLQVALGVGVGGALEDVSSYARLEDGLSYRWGRDDAFYGVEPGTFDFVLDNADGRFTPDNASSPLDTPLTEGMAACVSIGGRLTAGAVRSIRPEFPGDESAWASIRVSCDDVLGDAARTDVNDDLYGTAAALEGSAYWPMDDVEGSLFAREVQNGVRNFRSSFLTFGVDGVDGLPGTQVEVFSPAGVASELIAVIPGVADSFLQRTVWNFWLTVMEPNGYLSVTGVDGDTFGVEGTRFVFGSVDLGGVEIGRPYFISFEYAVDSFVYIDGVLVYSAGPALLPGIAGEVFIQVGDAAYGDSTFRLSRVSVGTLIRGERAFESTPAERLELVQSCVPTLTFDLDAGLSPATLGPLQLGSSALDAINEVVKAEQGYVHAATTGTLTSPTQGVIVRGRSRSTTVTASFDVEDELGGAPSFVRDLTNLVSAVTVRGPFTDVLVRDADLVARAASASASERLPFMEPRELRAWGQDRLLRGSITQLGIASVVVDAMTTPTDRSADLLALVPGDRVRFTGLPSTVLGFDEWDGWFLGASETHDVERHEFELFFQPVLPATAIYDTNRYMADGELTLTSTINSAVTSLSATSTGALLSRTETPYTIQFDSEQMTVTAVTGASSPQTVTVTRGANGTTAATHTAGAVLVSVPDSLYAF